MTKRLASLTLTMPAICCTLLQLIKSRLKLHTEVNLRLWGCLIKARGLTIYVCKRLWPLAYAGEAYRHAVFFTQVYFNDQIKKTEKKLVWHFGEPPPRARMYNIRPGSQMWSAEAFNLVPKTPKFVCLASSLDKNTFWMC